MIIFPNYKSNELKISYNSHFDLGSFDFKFFRFFGNLIVDNKAFLSGFKYLILKNLEFFYYYLLNNPTSMDKLLSLYSSVNTYNF